MTDLRQFPGTTRRACGLVCLAVLLLYTPAVQAAWLLVSGACCGGDRCPIAAHHHRAPETEEAPADCGHATEHSSRRVEGCSISCCRTAQEPAVHAHVFLPAPVLSFAPPEPSAPAAPKLR